MLLSFGMVCALKCSEDTSFCRKVMYVYNPNYQPPKHNLQRLSQELGAIQQVFASLKQITYSWQLAIYVSPRKVLALIHSRRSGYGKRAKFTYSAV